MPDPQNLHTERPTVYLDQWVWVDLARAAAGKPRRPSDLPALEAVRAASDAGVAFPLSVTHYLEMSFIKDPRQRRDLARLMGPVSKFRTMLDRGELLRHQMLSAMHEIAERPAFRPKPLEPMGVGVHWAFQGRQEHLRLIGDAGELDYDRYPGLRAWMRHVSQQAEMKVLAGPNDDEVDELRRIGFRPEANVETAASRLAWEHDYVELLRSSEPISRHELRVRVQSRELIHEDLDQFNKLVQEYRINFGRVFGVDPDSPRTRSRMVDFVDRMPTVRIAVDLKTEMHFDRNRTWDVNTVHDIDAASMMVPYCHVVVLDRDIATQVRRTGADARHETVVTNQLADLVDLLPNLQAAAAALDDPSGWDWMGPGAGFRIDAPGPFPVPNLGAGYRVSFGRAAAAGTPPPGTRSEVP